jgi:hypothetical protein
VISTTEHREPDLQTKIDIYLGLPIRLCMSECNQFSLGLATNTETYVDSTIDSANYTLDTSNQNHHFRGHHSPCSIFLEANNHKVHLNRENNEQRYIPKFPCQISDSEVRGYNIWNQDPNHTSLNYGCEKRSSYNVGPGFALYFGHHSWPLRNWLIVIIV